MKSLELLKTEINLIVLSELSYNSNNCSISYFYNEFFKNPKETLYYTCDLLDKNIIKKELFFKIIDSFVLNKDYEKFLNEYIFLSSKTLNDYLLLKIETNLYNKLLSFLSLKNKKIEQIKRSIFDSYYSNNQLEDCISFIKSNSLHLDDFLLETYGNGISDFNDTKHYKLNQLIICSLFTKNYKELLNYFFHYIPYTFESIKYEQINHNTLQCKLREIDQETKYAAYSIFKNTLSSSLDKSINLKSDQIRYLHTEIILLFLLSHDLFSEDEINSFFLYINTFCDIQEHFSDSIIYHCNNKKMNILTQLIYIAIKYNKLDIFSKLNNFFSKINLNSSFIIRSFMLLSKLDYNKFQEFVDNNKIFSALDLFFSSFYYENGEFYKNPNYDLAYFPSFNFFYQENLISFFLDHFEYLDPDIYQKIIDKHQNNLFISKHQLKTEMQNF